ncbi:PEGA domain-containing protein [Myxococcota bacterium]
MMGYASKPSVLWLATLATATPAARAWAESNVGPATLRAEADANLRNGQAADAVPKLERYHRQTQDYEVLWDLGWAYACIGRPVDAAAALKAYRKQCTQHAPAKDCRQVDEKIRQEEAKTATLQVRVEPRGATVRLDGRPLGTAPLGEPVRVAAGKHTVGAHRDGYAFRSVELTLGPGTQRTLELQLDPVFKPPKTDATARPRAWGYWLIAGGAALGVAAVSLLVWNHSRYQDTKGDEDDLRERPDGWRDWANRFKELSHQAEVSGVDVWNLGQQHNSLQNQSSDIQQSKLSVQKIDGLGIGLGVGAAALTGVGVALLLWSDGESPIGNPTATLHVGNPTATLDGGGLTVGWSQAF